MGPIISHEAKTCAPKNEAGDVPFQENIARVRKVRAAKAASGFRARRQVY